MKDLKEFINEGKKYFKLEEDERQALAIFTGILCGDLGDDDERKELQKVIDSLDEKDIEQISDLHSFLEDDVTYKSVNRNNIIDDIPLIKKLYKLMEDNDLLNEQWDLIDAFEKICLN